MLLWVEEHWYKILELCGMGRSRWFVVRGKGLLSKKKDDPRLSSRVVGGSIQRRGTSLHSIMEFNEDLIGIWSGGAFVWREILQILGVGSLSLLGASRWIFGRAFFVL